MACKIIYTKDKEGNALPIVDKVNASNGKRSILYDNIRTLKKDKIGEGSLLSYATIFTDKFKNKYGNWENKKGSLVLDSNGEPKLNEIINDINTTIVSDDSVGLSNKSYAKPKISKEGVSELFDSNPELANSVYEVLRVGQENNLSKNINELLGILETKGELDTEYFIDVFKDTPLSNLYENLPDIFIGYSDKFGANVRQFAAAHYDYGRNAIFLNDVNFSKIIKRNKKEALSVLNHELIHALLAQYHHKGKNYFVQGKGIIDSKFRGSKFGKELLLFLEDVDFSKLSNKNKILLGEIQTGLKPLEELITYSLEFDSELANDLLNQKVKGEKNKSFWSKLLEIILGKITTDKNKLDVLFDIVNNNFNLDSGNQDFINTQPQTTPQQKQQAQQKFEEYVNTTGKKDIEGFKKFLSQEGVSSFDTELSKTIQDRLQELYPEIKLDITNNPKWVDGDNVFNQEEYSSQVNYRLKAVEILLSDKAEKVFVKGKKAGWDLNKILTELQIPKEQKQILLNTDFGELYMSELSLRENLIMALVSETSFVVLIDTIRKERPFEDENSFTPDVQDASEIDDAEAAFWGPNPEYNASREYTEADNYIDPLIPSDIYSNLTVPGGTNYTENEISTPSITPNIIGHAEFSTEQGIGWFRSDDKVDDSKLNKVDLDKIGSQNLIAFSSENPATTTRRILEVQSDLFQKGRNRIVLDNELQLDEVFDSDTAIESLTEQQISYERQIAELKDMSNNTFKHLYESGIYTETKNREIEIRTKQLDDTKVRLENALRIAETGSPKNDFLQFLNKKNNWVTFFTKSIIQDSAKKGYTKVLFPKGDTAAKVEGQATLEEFKRQKEDAIKQSTERIAFSEKKIEKLEKELKELREESSNDIENDDLDLYLSKIKDNVKLADAILDEIQVEKDYIDKSTKLITQYKAELANVESGQTQLSSIAKFYEDTITNILKKQGYNPIEITDEYGNKWNEVSINQPRDLSNILLQKDEANRIIGQANIKAMTVVVDAALQRIDSIPHEFAHHYIAWFRNSDLVQEGIKRFGGEEALVQAIGEQVVKQKGEAYNWWKKFTKWMLSLFSDKQVLETITNYFLQGVDVNTGLRITPEQSIELAASAMPAVLNQIIDANDAIKRAIIRLNRNPDSPDADYLNYFISSSTHNIIGALNMLLDNKDVADIFALTGIDLTRVVGIDLTNELEYRQAALAKDLSLVNVYKDIYTGEAKMELNYGKPKINPELAEKVQNHYNNHTNRYGLYLSDILDAPQLYSLFPGIAETLIDFKELPKTSLGAATSKKLQDWASTKDLRENMHIIYLNMQMLDDYVNIASGKTAAYKSNKFYETLIHEIQHSVQIDQKSPRGSSGSWINNIIGYHLDEFTEQFKGVDNTKHSVFSLLGDYNADLIDKARVVKGGNVDSFKDYKAYMRTLSTSESKYYDELKKAAGIKIWEKVIKKTKTTPEKKEYYAITKSGIIKSINPSSDKRIVERALDNYLRNRYNPAIMYAEKYQHLTTNTAYQYYLRTAGEVEARNADFRSKLKRQDARRTNITDTEDIDISSQIFFSTDKTEMRTLSDFFNSESLPKKLAEYNMLMENDSLTIESIPLSSLGIDTKSQLPTASLKIESKAILKPSESISSKDLNQLITPELSIATELKNNLSTLSDKSPEIQIANEPTETQSTYSLIDRLLVQPDLPAQLQAQAIAKGLLENTISSDIPKALDNLINKLEKKIDEYDITDTKSFLQVLFNDNSFTSYLSNLAAVRSTYPDALTELVSFLSNKYDMSQESISDILDYNTSKDNIEYEYPTENAEELKEEQAQPSIDKTFNTEVTPEQERIIKLIENTKSLDRGKKYLTADQLSKLLTRKDKNLKLLLTVKDGMTRNVIWDNDTEQEIIVKNRPSDFGQLLFSKSKNFDKEKVNQGNNDRDNIIKRGMGTALHHVMEELIVELDRQNSDLSMLKPHFGKMGTWDDFYKAKYNEFVQNISSNSELANIYNQATTKGTYAHVIDEDALIDPIEDAPTLTEEERTFRVDSKDLQELAKLAFKTYFNIYQTQASMKWHDSTPVGRPVIIPEAPVYSPNKDIKGSIDLLVVYDNGKVGHFDWKFMALSDAMKKEKNTDLEVLERQKLNLNNKNRWGYHYVPYMVKDKLHLKRDAFEAQVKAYKDILIDSYNINSGDIIQSRVIPVNMVLKTKNVGSAKTYINKRGKRIKYFEQEILNSLQFVDHIDTLLSELSLAKELTDDEQINRFLTNLYKEKDIVQYKLTKNRSNIQIRERLNSLNDIISLLTIQKDVANVASKTMELAESVEKHLSEPKYIDSDDVPISNPRYIEDIDLNEFENVLKMYSDLMASSENHLAKLEAANTDPVVVDNVKDMLIKQNRVVTRVLNTIAKERDLRLMNIAQEGTYNIDSIEYQVNVSPLALTNAGVGTSDRISKYSDINMLAQNFNALSDLNHPHVRMYKDLLDSMNANVKDYVEEVESRIKSPTEELKKWSNANNMSTVATYKKFIDESNGYLIKQYTQELFDRLRKAREDRDYEWLKDNIVFDVDKFNEKRERVEKLYRRVYLNDEDAIRDKMNQFDEMFDMRLSDYAYANPKNNLFTFKEETQSQYIDPRWLYIQKHKALRDFYNMHKEMIADIKNIIGEGTHVSDYFIPNVHKDIVDISAQEGIFSMEGLSNIQKMISKTIAIRENDEDFGYVIDDTVIDDVPLLYVDQVPGGIANKSFDLSKSLLLFAYSAKSHQIAKQLEGVSASIRRSLVSTKLLKKDRYGNLIMGETVSNTEDSKLVQTLDSYIKKYIYGQNLQTGVDAIGGKKAALIVQGLMSAHSKANLALNHLSLLGEFFNARSQALAEATKGKHFTHKQMAEAQTTFSKLSKESQLAQEFFQVTAEGNSGIVYEKANKLSLSELRKRYNRSAAFYFHRNSDDSIDSIFLVAMMKNYILHPNGRDVFPKSEAHIYLKGTEYEGLDMKTMWESIQVKENPQEGDKVFDILSGDGSVGITQKQFIKFRNKVRKISAKAKGNYQTEDDYGFKTNMLMRPIMQYRQWIPAFVAERYAAPDYDSTLEEVEIGRYRVALGEIIGNGAIPAMKNFLKLASSLGVDVATFGKFNLTQPSLEKSKMYFEKWAANNPGEYAELLDKYRNFDNPRSEALKEWHRTRHDQLKKIATEVRMYMLVIGAMLAVGFGAGEDEVKKNPFIRSLLDVMDRVKMEIGFFFSAEEMSKLVSRSPVPVYGIVNDALKMLSNTLEEGIDLAYGVDDDKTMTFVKRGKKPFQIETMVVEPDRSPMFKYTFKLVPILKGVTNWAEVSDSGKEKTTFYDYIFGGDDSKVYK